MKFRKGFVSNSSTSSFLVTNNKVGLATVKALVAEIATQYNVDPSYLEYVIINEESLLEKENYRLDYYPFLYDILPDYYEYQPIREFQESAGTLRKENFEEYKRRMNELRAQYEAEVATVLQGFIDSEKFIEVNGMIHIIGEQNDEFVHTLTRELYEYGRHIHMG